MRRALPLLTLLAPSVVHAATLQVGATRTYKTISTAITAAASGDRIEVDAGTYTEGLAIAKSLTIVGAGSGSTVLYNSGSGDTVDISGSTVTVAISGMEVRGRSGAASQRGIDIAQSTLTLDDVLITLHGIASGSAGAGLRIQNGATVTITDSLFDTNGVYNANGGHIYVDDSTLTVSGTDFSVGLASYDGGAIYATDSDVTISDALFDANEVDDDGGAIYAVGGTWAITSAIFSGNISGDNGGALRIGEGIDATLTDVIFDANEAVDGAGLYAGTTTTSTAATNITLDSVTFTANDLWDYGAGAAIYASGTTFTSTGTTVANHTTAFGWQYPIVALASSSWDGVNDLFTGNSATYSGADGGAVTMTGSSTATFTGATFSGNSVAGTGGYGGAIAFGSTGALTLDGVTFSDNESPGYGGAIYSGSSGDLAIDGATFSANTGGAGGGIFVGGSGDLAITASAFTSNSTSASSGGAVQFNGTTGAMTLTISDSTFDSNSAASATYGGGAVVVFNGIVAVSDSQFTDNSALYGGALYFGDTADRLTFTNNVLCANSATGAGGGAYVDVTAAYATLAFTNNVAAENTAGTYGGGLVIDGTATTGTPASIVNNTFLGNSASTQGGGAYFDTYFSFVNNIVASSTGGNGVGATASAYARSLTYGDWSANTTANLGGGLSSTSLDTTNVLSDPMLSAWSADGDCTNDEFWPKSGSPVIDAGSTAILDADGSRSDIGAYGGPSADEPPITDGDGDGYTAGVDCDDDNAAINPAATEICNDVDDDCDGTIDDTPADGVTLYADGDDDGYGDSATGQLACAGDAGWVSDSSDCDDDDDTAYPGAAETCDGDDDDCDSAVDESAIDMGTWYADGDTDGYGTDASATMACDAPTGHVSTGGDCDDATAAVNPAATEVCDSIDNDCDGTVDLGVSGMPTYYADADADGFGDDGASTTACDAPTGYVTGSGDCDDSAPTAFPGGTEVCDALDNDCDGTVDEDATDAVAFYADADDDGYGTASATVDACDAPDGYAATDDDCNDADVTINPGADELCNDADDDCDGTVDESDAIDAGTWHPDADVDGFGDAASATVACDAPDGYLADGSDCDDTDASITIGDLYFGDADGDGFGDPADSTTACSPPSGYVVDARDCDDTNGAVNPDAAEYCDLLDNDCDGEVDESDALDAMVWYEDGDSDGWGDTALSSMACDAPPGSVARDGDCNDADALYHPFAAETCDDTVDYNCDGSTGTDDKDADGWIACEECDDSDATVNPDAPESCNGLDDDCDGTIDEEAADALTWYADTDADGYGDLAVTALGCEAPDGFVSDSTDCNDSDGSYYPGAPEICADGLDTNCDGSLGTDDLDSDGAIACDDCDDADGAVFPGADEACNTVDDDCDGEIDEDGATFGEAWYADGDGDGHGNAASSVTDCEPPTGYVDSDDDCDDGDAASYPGADEIWYDGIDEACDGGSDFDQDGDGHDSDQHDGDDCDDLDADVNPDALDTPNDGVDADCDGLDSEPGDTDQPGDTDTGEVDEEGKGCKCDASTSNPAGFYASFVAILGLVGLRRRRLS